MSSSPIPILMYHNVDIPQKHFMLRGLYVSPQLFRIQMWLLKFMGYQGLSMSKLLPYLRGIKSGKVVGITFDDGYQDTLSNALPILQNYGFQATCYIVANRIGDCNSWDIAKGMQRKDLMDKTQIGKWIDAGMEIGSHTLDHVNLEQHRNNTLLRNQIQGSKNVLEDTFNVPIDHFCYPYGSYSDEVINAVELAGYHTATTTQRSRIHPSDSLLELPRVMVSRSTLPHLFWAKIKTGYEDRRR